MSTETYKGIEFIRISNLPDEQKAQIIRTIEQHQIIKIQRDQDLLSDCVQLRDYKQWKAEKFTITPLN